MTGASIAVFLADDNAIVRDRVRAILPLEPDLERVGAACDYDELIVEAKRTPRDSPSRPSPSSATRRRRVWPRTSSGSS
jgi:chemotaxis response regulator CheB